MATKKLSQKARYEIERFNLATNADYNNHCADYILSYTRRPPPKTTPTKNILKALRMLPWRNTPEDWARLHITEAFCRSN